uniref:Uncharacterized protein n=1 Tax=Chromera velia CCMP2878 TaxID=1169474 RepID=A0A0G4FCP4_9ALVE|eukprot:Cvel_16384.t1-p1 / transcript=Cvel_16384.t1 / gene=Cvel_16384 / organism=Chromera_velia_CCMP2878 / gene_product=hypothetical protein / transcript_product=hypothetical protein / location=Cvel_scaffold1260:25249-27356(+) / protein_length=668 / sequence_SO=supercontig / SO=protein_coding / is_pseudo=false
MSNPFHNENLQDEENSGSRAGNQEVSGVGAALGVGEQGARAFVRACVLGEVGTVRDAVRNGVSPTVVAHFSSEADAESFVAALWSSRRALYHLPQTVPNPLVPPSLPTLGEGGQRNRGASGSKRIFPQLSGLLAACLCGEVGLLHALLEIERGRVDVNEKINGKTLILYMCEKNPGDRDAEIIEVLLNHGGNPLIVTPGTPPPIAQALLSQNAPLVQQLLKSDVLPDMRIRGGPARASEGGHGDADLVCNRVSLLHWALEKLPFGQLQGLDAFLSLPYSNVQNAVLSADREGEGLLNSLVRRYKKALGRGRKMAPRRDWRPPEPSSLWLTNLRAADALTLKIRWGDPNAADSSGVVPFTLAARRLPSLPVGLRGPRGLLSADKDGKAALSHAAAAGNETMVKALVEEMGSRGGSAITRELLNALRCAVSAEKPAIVRALVADSNLSFPFPWRPSRDFLGRSLLEEAGVGSELRGWGTGRHTAGVLVWLFGGHGISREGQESMRRHSSAFVEKTAVEVRSLLPTLFSKRGPGAQGQSEGKGVRVSVFLEKLPADRLDLRRVCTVIPPLLSHHTRLMNKLNSRRALTQFVPLWDRRVVEPPPSQMKKTLQESLKGLFEVVRVHMKMALRFHSTVLLALGEPVCPTQIAVPPSGTDALQVKWLYRVCAEDL